MLAKVTVRDRGVAFFRLAPAICKFQVKNQLFSVHVLTVVNTFSSCKNKRIMVSLVALGVDCILTKIKNKKHYGYFI